jgi:hypothetical protein
MASFILPPTIEELLSPLGVDEDPTLCIWAYSGRRSPWEMVCAFLNADYNNCHLGAHPIYYLQRVAYRAIVMRYVNPLDARLLYGRCYHCGYEMVVFTSANIFTTTRTSSLWAARSTCYASWSCSRNSSMGGRWRCQTSSTTRSGARGEELATEGASEQEMGSLASVLFHISLSSVSSSSTYRYVL